MPISLFLSRACLVNCVKFSHMLGVLRPHCLPLTHVMAAALIDVCIEGGKSIENNEADEEKYKVGWLERAGMIGRYSTVG